MKSSKAKTPVKATLAPATRSARQKRQYRPPRQPMHRSLSRAAMQQQSSQSLASSLVMRSYTATRHTLSPSSHRPLLLPLRRHPKPRKCKSIDMCLLGNRADHGAVSCLSQIPSPTNRRGTRSHEEGRRSSKRTLFFVGSLEPLLLARRQAATAVCVVGCQCR